VGLSHPMKVGLSHPIKVGLHLSPIEGKSDGERIGGLKAVSFLY